jgi:hypothetical protein
MWSTLVSEDEIKELYDAGAYHFLPRNVTSSSSPREPGHCGSAAAVNILTAHKTKSKRQYGKRKLKPNTNYNEETNCLSYLFLFFASCLFAGNDQ